MVRNVTDGGICNDDEYQSCLDIVDILMQVNEMNDVEREMLEGLTCAIEGYEKANHSID